MPLNDTLYMKRMDQKPNNTTTRSRPWWIQRYIYLMFNDMIVIGRCTEGLRYSTRTLHTNNVGGQRHDFRVDSIDSFHEYHRTRFILILTRYTTLLDWESRLDFKAQVHTFMFKKVKTSALLLVLEQCQLSESTRHACDYISGPARFGGQDRSGFANTIMWRKRSNEPWNLHGFLTMKLIYSFFKPRTVKIQY